ncbi:hypothetical protein WJX75_004513 [Coccomyxa subellipsoidea]|uniref:Uncharacterized protein n=1 Tax=Coccomyxa subellipsoidea TaxID=248742 RepID=A0ABR2Z0F1_9CHLO
MDSQNKQVWRKEAVVASASGKDFSVLYRTDFHELLQELLLHPQASSALSRRAISSHALDTDSVSSGTGSGCMRYGIMQQGGLFRYLAYLPSFTGAEIGLNKKRDKAELKELRRSVLLPSVDLVLGQPKADSYRCQTFHVGASRTPMKLVPIPCNYVADGLEAGNFLLVKANSKHPDVHSLIPKEQLDNPDALYPQRTEKRTRKIVKRIKQLMKEGADGKRQAKNLMDDWSLQCAEESPLAGFAGTDCYRLIQPDPMHQADKGDTESALDLLKDSLDEDGIALIDERLATIQPMHGLALPSRGLSTVKMYASQQAALLRCLPVALLGLEGEVATALRVVIPAYLDFERLRDLDVHDEESLARLEAACRRYQMLALENLGGFRSFKTSKFHAHGKYVPLIRWLGSATLASASPGEATHKIIKEGYLNSNKKSGGLEEQIRDHGRNLDLARSISADPATDMPARSAGQLAVQTLSHQLINHSKRLHYKQLSSGSSADAAWLERRPELLHLERCLRLYLGALAGLPDAADLDILPDAKGDLLCDRQVRGGGLVRATPACF